MGVISDILDSIFGGGSTGSTDPKSTEYSEKDDNIRVRNSDVIIDHDNKSHSTIWSTTDVNTKTGDATVREGGHGENFKK